MPQIQEFTLGSVWLRKANPAGQEIGIVVSKTAFNTLPKEESILMVPIRKGFEHPSATEVPIAQKDYPQFLASDSCLVADKLKRTKKNSWERKLGELTIADTNACLAALRSLFTAIPPLPK